MDSYCYTCNSFFKLISSCPRAYIFDDGTSSEKFLEVLWVASSAQLYFIYSLLVIFIIFRRTSRALLLLIGLALQQFINDVIFKRSLAEARPPGACSHSYGLPSGHSSFASFLATWLILEWVMFHDKVPFRKSKFNLVFRVIGLIVCPFIPISRYFLNYHSVKQILYGTLDGFVLAILYFTLVVALLYKDEGRFWGYKVTNLLQKVWFRDNFIDHEMVIVGEPKLIDEDAPSQEQSNLDNQTNLQKENSKLEFTQKTQDQLILPLREGVEKLIFQNKVASSSHPK